MVALGAEIVLWPTAMATPDRDMMSLAGAFRFGIVGCVSTQASLIFTATVIQGRL